MIARFLLLTVCFLGGLAQEDAYDIADGVNILKNLTNEADRKVEGSVALLDSAGEEMSKMAVDRLECIEWEYKTQKQCLNKSITEAVAKGMAKNKPFPNFQCISTAGSDVGAKLNVIFNLVPETTRKLKAKALAGVEPFRLLTSGLTSYISDLYRIKHEELIKAKKEQDRKKILDEADTKMKELVALLEQINTKVRDSRFQFFSEFVDYIHATENNLKKTQKEGSQKVLKCVA